jgi:Protein of unknown function (DUF3363)/MobA/VirD2-like, nuclease domain
MENDEPKHEFQVRPPRRRPKPADEARVWNSAFKKIVHFARMSSRGRRRKSDVGTAARYGQHEFKQRCAVRVTYTANRTRGQWRSHGHYLARESANPDQPTNGLGFGPSDQPIPLGATLSRWQTASDPRLFKIIISPEFGDRLDLEKLTRELMTKMEVDLGTCLEWVATVHDDTQFPHVHVALRGIRDDGRGLRLNRDYLKHGIRADAQDAATAQIGYRTEFDAQEAERREIHQQRFTSLDRMLSRNGREYPMEDSGHFSVDLIEGGNKVRHYALQARLLFLNSMGLAEKTGRKSWRVRSDFETVLRAMQRTNDRQRALANHLMLLSDSRLQSCVTDISQVEHLEGRVLGHGEEENTGRAYMLMEGTDHHVHFIYHTPQIVAARQDGNLKPDSFLRISAPSTRTPSVPEIEDLGDATRLLANREYLRRKARDLVSRGIIPLEHGLGGWLGRYEAALVEAAATIRRKSSEELENRRVPPARGR